MPLTDAIIEESIDRYWREIDRYAKLASYVAEKCNELVEAKLIRATVTFRAKDLERLRGRLRKLMKTPAEANTLNSVDDVFKRIGDLAGVRIATYVERDRDLAVEELKKAFVGGEGAPGIEVDKKDARDKLYRATHCQVAVPEEALVGIYANLKGLTCEVQVCSLLAHAYNEIEHDIRYKQLTGRLSDTENERLDGLGKLTASGDVMIEAVLEAQERRQAEIQGEFEDEYDFVARMRRKFEDADRFQEHALQLYEELLALGLDSPEKIEADLLTGDYSSRSQEHLVKLQRRCDLDTPTVVSVDAATSDRLLVLLLEKHTREVETRHPAGRGRGRPPRIRSLATRYRQIEE